MTNLLQKVFEEAGKLPESEQEALGALILDELALERRWTTAFAESADRLAEMAEEALAEHREHRTLPLDPDTL